MNEQRIGVEGVKFFREVINHHEATTLLDFIAGFEFRTIAMRGMVARRTVACFGFDYVYQSRSVVEVTAIPEVLRAVKARCAEVAGVNDRFDQVLVSRYPANAEIG